MAREQMKVGANISDAHREVSLDCQNNTKFEY